MKDNLAILLCQTFFKFLFCIKLYLDWGLVLKADPNVVLKQLISPDLLSFEERSRVLELIEEMIAEFGACQ